MSLTATISNSIIRGARNQIGIRASNGAELSITHNTFYSAGIKIEGWAQVVVFDNEFYHSRIETMARDEDNPRATIDGNLFHGSSQGTAIWQVGGDVTYVGNVFEGVSVDDNVAIRVTDSLEPEPKPGLARILGNEISGFETGIMLGASSAITVEENVIWDADTGLFLDDESRAAVLGNTLTNVREGLTLGTRRRPTFGTTASRGTVLAWLQRCQRREYS